MTARQRGSDRGAATVEFVVAAPFLMAMLVLVVQVGLWMHGRNVMTAAASEAARAAAGADLSSGQAQSLGAATARDFVAGTTNTVTGVQVSRSSDVVVAKVSGRAQLLFFQANTESSVQVPVERFVPQGS